MIVAAKQSFFASGSVRVRAGELFDSSHPIPTRFPDLFAAPDHHGVEQATNAPGESRTTRRGSDSSATRAKPKRKTAED